MPLSPDAQVVFDRLAQAGNLTIEDLGLDVLRTLLANFNRIDSDGPEVPTEDATADGVPVRLYRPDDAVGTLVWFHGGGWCLGSMDEHDAFCRRFAVAAGTTIVNVDYRLAPEHPFPAGFDDCYAATKWAAATLPGPTAVGGDSAGGNLAAAVTFKARDDGPPLAFQLLVYPAVDAEMSYPSMKENGEGYFLYEADTRWFWDHYLAGHDRRDPLASPIYADDLGGLPPAYVVTTEYDPLRDEGEAYALRLEQAGVPTLRRRWDGELHAFFTAGKVYAAAQPATEEAAAALRAALRGTG
ncbi:MAG TPA: alpha/beta hydrolase [Acidimicrobiales bacterium]|nr:alpha/beta hydrolase [Acidimicrobiales bacterium]